MVFFLTEHRGRAVISPISLKFMQPVNVCGAADRHHTALDVSALSFLPHVKVYFDNLCPAAAYLGLNS